MKKPRVAFISSMLMLNASILVAEGKEIASSQDGSSQEGPILSSDKSSKVFMASQMRDSHRLFATGEVLLWKASQDNLGFAVKSSSTTSIQNGRNKNIDSDWDWGFRVGVGYRIPHDEWDIGLNYTHFQSQAHAHEFAPAGGAVFPQWQGPAGSGYATEAKAHWRLHLQLSDLELGRAVGVGQWLSIRPHIGVRAAWIYQKYEIEYEGGTAVPAGDIDEINMRNNFWGIGARFGVDSLWGLGKGFSLYGDGSFSLLSGFFSVQQQEHLEVAGWPLLNLTSHPNNVVTIFDLSMGFQYDRFFSRNRYHLGVNLGYEFNYFFDQNQFMRFLSGRGSISRSKGDLSLMGVTLGLRFDF